LVLLCHILAAPAVITSSAATTFIFVGASFIVYSFFLLSSLLIR
jgi:hypothetical protein